MRSIWQFLDDKKQKQKNIFLNLKKQKRDFITEMLWRV